MIMTILSVLAFLVIGAVIGYVACYFFDRSSIPLSILLGMIGSVGLSWCAKLLGVGAGILSFSLWGIVAGILGACLLVVGYGILSRRLG